MLFVDEAAQMSLANVLAVSQAATSLVLLGDPQQLEQPMQGSHPEGTDVSALEHMLGGEKTIAADRGLFLGETWRLHPEICAFTSELFYEGRLHSSRASSARRFDRGGRVRGTGLRYVPCQHEGNQSSSPEEAERRRDLVAEHPRRSTSWIDRQGESMPIASRRHPGHRALQRAGVRAAGADARRARRHRRQVPGAGGADRHLLDDDIEPRRRAARHGVPLQPQPAERRDIARRCVCILVGSPPLFEPECRTPQQMQLANAFCRYLELATA